MTSKQTAAICATILLAAIANLAGGFAIQFYFAGRQSFTNDRQRAHFEAGSIFGDLGSVGRSDPLNGSPHLRPVPTAESHELVPLPPPGSDTDEHSGTLIGDGVGQPAEDRNGRRYSPRELSNPRHAVPIAPRPLLNARLIAEIIQRELPDATAEEQEVWKKQLAGLGPNEARDLLQMRRRFGSELPGSLKSSAPLVVPLERDDPEHDTPVVAPVPATEQ